MSVALLAISDGRHPYHQRSLESALEHLPKFDQHVWVDDPDHELGFAGAIQAGWEQIDTDYVFHLELDFVLLEDVPMSRMVRLLDRHPHVAQLVLKRQPWNEQEIAAGGIVEQHPEDYEDCFHDDEVWAEHRRFWSTNPSLYPARWCRVGWPQGDRSEGTWTHRLLEDRELRFAFWGGKYRPPMVHHIGETRGGKGY